MGLKVMSFIHHPDVDIGHDVPRESIAIARNMELTN
jgi:hypothetical protein